MKILGVMQNQWFRDPDRIRTALARQPTDERRYQYRQRLIAYALFAGCKSGRVLTQTLGSDLCDAITWEEASPQIGGKASSCFPADLSHLESVLARERPDIIVAFGEIAGNALRSLNISNAIFAPHPTARRPGTLDRLTQVALELESRLASS
jgi:hypothetical protein